MVTPWTLDFLAIQDSHSLLSLINSLTEDQGQYLKEISISPPEACDNQPTQDPWVFSQHPAPLLLDTMWKQKTEKGFSPQEFLLDILPWPAPNSPNHENKNLLWLPGKFIVYHILSAGEEEKTWPGSWGKDSLSYLLRFIYEKALRMIRLCNMPPSCSEYHQFKAHRRGFQNHPEHKSKGGTGMGGQGEKTLSCHHLKPLDYLNFCRIMIAYLKVIHLFLSFPTPMWFSNPEVITFWQKFIGTSVFSLRSAGHCATLTAAQQRAALEKPSTMAGQVQATFTGRRVGLQRESTAPTSDMPSRLVLWGAQHGILA